MKSLIRGFSARAAVAASAMAGCATFFLSSIVLMSLFGAQWAGMAFVGGVVCAVAVARYVWRLGVGLRWALLTTLFAFSVISVTPEIIGGPGSSLGWVFAIILTPVIFAITLMLTLISPRLAIVTIVASLLFPVWYYVRSPQEGTLRPLTADEQALIKSRHFELQVAVDAGGFPPVYREKLLRDLDETKLFTEISPIERTRSPDLIATVTGNYYGDTMGNSFTLNWAKQPERKVNVKVWHYQRLSFDSLRGRTRQLELERLALEVIRQIDALGPLP